MRRHHRLSIALIAAAALFALPATALTQRAPQAAQKTVVAVTGVDFKFRLSRTSAPAGIVVFRFTNRGKLAHNFKIAGRLTPTINPGATATLQVTLGRGNYRYVCTVPGHIQLGMVGTFHVG